MSDNPLARPAKGWELVARKQIVVGSNVYPRGSVVPVTGLKNLQVLIDTKALVWTAPSDAPRPQPRAIPAPEKERPRPPVEIMGGDDPVAAWHATVAHMTKKCGSEWWAKELIHLSRDGRDLYRLAVASAREAASRGAAAQGKHLVNIDIDALGL